MEVTGNGVTDWNRGGEGETAREAEFRVRLQSRAQSEAGGSIGSQTVIKLLLISAHSREQGFDDVPLQSDTNARLGTNSRVPINQAGQEGVVPQFGDQKVERVATNPSSFQPWHS
ncbi:hypothetical protein NDU88_010809 [Pleurodeles waltl]|uniref:Uncharacterized protein n=1 Tax=Pleurodeles waltl TaxID=8319 RepID=A0AAV7QVS0_PLEWA|nr:hypothetical protein NDU88_010809 [Pleurodeles waltl]